MSSYMDKVLVEGQRLKGISAPFKVKTYSCGTSPEVSAFNKAIETLESNNLNLEKTHKETVEIMSYRTTELLKSASNILKEKPRGTLFV